jgi:hypothetical protein
VSLFKSLTHLVFAIINSSTFSVARFTYNHANLRQNPYW